ncbi:MAG: alpha/beta fold hydrolase [Saprospiraceae bacterium]|nr:alpha/beta fold hydrolase [Saprospiraceae bacterium]
MPLQKSDYNSPVYFFNGHIETIYPYLFRKIPALEFVRERLLLPDGDFLDLDWLRQEGKRLLILCHGLEGSSASQYMQGMATAALNAKWDVLALNFRSCSGEMNQKLRMYHHGEIEDLTFVLNTIVANGPYRQISLCGFSLGGNVILKYLGTQGGDVPLPVRSAVAISVPCDLESSSRALDRWDNYLYTRRFMRSLKSKFIYKSKQFPNAIDMTGFDAVKTWEQFDNTFTPMVTGFKNAAEYYAQGSAKNFIPGIRTNVLLLNALNDPFLKAASFPIELCKNHSYVHLETPKHGGHVGFWYPSLAQSYAEKRALQFINQQI